MGEEEKKKVEEHLLLKEEVINLLDSAVKDFRERKSTDLVMYAKVENAWQKANDNPKIHQLIEDEIRKRRLELHQLAEIDLSRGDPVRKRYDPTFWVKKPPSEFKTGKEFQKFILERIDSLREFLVNLPG